MKPKLCQPTPCRVSQSLHELGDPVSSGIEVILGNYRWCFGASARAFERALQALPRRLLLRIQLPDADLVTCCSLPALAGEPLVALKIIRSNDMMKKAGASIPDLVNPVPSAVSPGQQERTISPKLLSRDAIVWQLLKLSRTDRHWVAPMLRSLPHLRHQQHRLTRFLGLKTAESKVLGPQDLIL